MWMEPNREVCLATQRGPINSVCVISCPHQNLLLHHSSRIKTPQHYYSTEIKDFEKLPHWYRFLQWFCGCVHVGFLRAASASQCKCCGFQGGQNNLPQPEKIKGNKGHRMTKVRNKSVVILRLDEPTWVSLPLSWQKATVNWGDLCLCPLRPSWNTEDPFGEEVSNIKWGGSNFQHGTWWTRFFIPNLAATLMPRLVGNKRLERNFLVVQRTKDHLTKSSAAFWSPLSGSISIKQCKNVINCDGRRITANHLSYHWFFLSP